MPDGSADPHADPTGIFVGFTHALSMAGLSVGPDRTQVFVDAAVRVGVGVRDNVYWAGRATLCASPDEIATFDRTFERWFSNIPATTSERPSVPRSVTQADLGDESGSAEAEEERLVAILASDDDALRHRDVATLSATERRRLGRLFAGLPLVVPERRGIRRRPHRSGAIDAARTVREQLRRAGEPGPLRFRRPKVRPRRVVFLIDVSGSMEPYADSLLRLAHRMVTAAPHSTEVFTLGTKLTRVTSSMRLRNPEQALLAAGRSIPDWSGGTRIGEMLREFLDRYGQRGVARGAVAVIASDGWEIGDSRLLGEQVERLQRLARVVLWSNPHTGKAGYAPVQSGIVAALPHLNGLVAGHSLAAFTELLGLIADA